MFERRKTTYEFEKVTHRRVVWWDTESEPYWKEYTYESYPCWNVNAQQIGTQNERSQSSLLEYDEDALEYGVRARAKRNHRNLPTNWEDKRIAAWDYRNSWKHYSKRRKQWKPL